MVDQETLDFVRAEAVKATLATLSQRLGRSNVKISRTSAGKPSFEVKVYDLDPMKAANRAVQIERQLAREYMDIESGGQANYPEEEGACPPFPARLPEDAEYDDYPDEDGAGDHDASLYPANLSETGEPIQESVKSLFPGST